MRDAQKHQYVAAPKGFRQHDHGKCVREALASAESQCSAEGLRLTPARRRVLEILLEEHQAMGAYDVLARLQADGQNAQPPAAYRALKFLVDNGFAHRLEHKNAFVACAHPGEDHLPAFLVCRGCEIVAEVATPGRLALNRMAKDIGFTIDLVTFEAQGLCGTCQSAAEAQ